MALTSPLVPPQRGTGRRTLVGAAGGTIRRRENRKEVSHGSARTRTLTARPGRSEWLVPPSGSRAITAKRCGTLLPRIQTTFHRPLSPSLRGSLPSRVLKEWAGECASTYRCHSLKDSLATQNRRDYCRGDRESCRDISGFQASENGGEVPPGGSGVRPGGGAWLGGG